MECSMECSDWSGSFNDFESYVEAISTDPEGLIGDFPDDWSSWMDDGCPSL